jgi:hypothetical protein
MIGAAAGLRGYLTKSVPVPGSSEHSKAASGLRTRRRHYPQHEMRSTNYVPDLVESWDLPKTGGKC